MLPAPIIPTVRLILFTIVLPGANGLKKSKGLNNIEL
jgi:hypothetical protein